MIYLSTNNNSPYATLREAVLGGLAPDRGLYMPSEIPSIGKKELDSFAGKAYYKIAADILYKFFYGEISYDHLEEFSRESYVFDTVLEKVERARFILRLDRGPTASFKDYAARIMARLINYYLEEEDRYCTVLTATSGDTGSAVASAFTGMDRIKVVILYPANEVSKLQRKQMTTIGANVNVLEVKAKFDDCQLMVKKAFSDPGLRSLNLTTANSINIGRLLPQAAYYFYAYSRLASNFDKLLFSVPSGNFGNLLAGIIAKRMGLPVNRFIVSVNRNDEFPLFLNSGIYKKIAPSINCISSAMNVGHPSNLSRLVYLYGGSMDEEGRIRKMPDLDLIRKDIVSYSIDDNSTLDTIGRIWKKHSVLLEPHGSVAWTGMEKYSKAENIDQDTAAIVLETAHPAKFPDAVYSAAGILPDLPESLSGLDSLKEHYSTQENSYPDFKAFLLKDIR